MAFWNGTGGGEGNTKENKFSFSFYKGKADEKPYFKVKRFAPEQEELENATEIKWILKWVFYNVSDKPEYSDEVKVILEDWEEAYYVSFKLSSVVAPMLNSLLAVDKNTEIRFAAYVNKDGYKNIGVFNPNSQVEITTKEGKKITVDESFRWVFNKGDLPTVSVTKNKAGKVVDVDDNELNAFFKEKINEKFNPDNWEEASEEPKPKEGANAEEISVEDVPF